jgi:hypothetical protein
MPIITLPQAKEMMQLKNDSSKDSLINSLIKPIEQFIKTYTKNDFLVDGVETFPEDLQLIAVQVIGRFINRKAWQGVQSETIDVNTVSIMNDLPKWALSILNSYRRIKVL